MSNKESCKTCYEEIEKLQQELFDKWKFCSDHNFVHECQALNLKLDTLNFVLLRMRMNKLV